MSAHLGAESCELCFAVKLRRLPQACRKSSLRLVQSHASPTPPMPAPQRLMRLHRRVLRLVVPTVRFFWAYAAATVGPRKSSFAEVALEIAVLGAERRHLPRATCAPSEICAPRGGAVTPA